MKTKLITVILENLVWKLALYYIYKNYPSVTPSSFYVRRWLEKKKCKKSWLGDYKSRIMLPPTPNNNGRLYKPRRGLTGGRSFPNIYRDSREDPWQRVRESGQTLGMNAVTRTAFQKKNKDSRIYCRRNNVEYQIYCIAFLRIEKIALFWKNRVHFPQEIDIFFT